ncbi:MAG TPA: UDP-2,4-diacetamido-2,4,6-trideoxy-beta-L-altropyranose hydrolase, partial [Flavisolibacter sp.]
MENRTIIFRADGNSDIGLGHLVRSSALAAMLREQYACVLATRCRMIDQLPDVRDSFTRIIELPEKSYEAEAAEFHNITGPADLVVLDGYAFDGAYQHQLTRNGFDLFSIDDIHSFKFHSKVIINHAGGITPLDYAAWPFTQYFLGPHYSLLRGAFLRAAKDRRNAISDNNCIVCFGGADPVNRTMQVVQDLCKRSDQVDHIHVVVGSAYRFHAELNDFIGGRENISVHHAVSTGEMVRIMQQCSFA